MCTYIHFKYRFKSYREQIHSEKCKNLTEKWDGRFPLENSETSDENSLFHFTCL